MSRQKVRGAGERMRTTMRSGYIACKVPAGVDQRLTFGHAAGGDTEIDGVGAQPLLRQLERRARPGRRLEEDVYDDLPRRVGTFLMTALEISLKLRRIHDQFNSGSLRSAMPGDVCLVAACQHLTGRISPSSFGSSGRRLLLVDRRNSHFYDFVFARLNVLAT